MKTKILITILTSGLLLFSCSNHKGNKEKTSAGKVGKPKQEINSQKTDNSMAKPIYLTKADFLTKVANYEQNPDKWVYLGDKPCIIDFYADWCGPCKMIAPILEELAQEYEGQIYIYKVDTDAEQELAADFGIRSIPTLLFCPMNENPQMAQGALPKDVLKEVIEEVLLKKS
ncbi:MAG: thioredoxin [Bacteroidales bacterium]|jgi:thioredoxin|nr:thioredoxin [Bacteroidales bacterium]